MFADYQYYTDTFKGTKIKSQDEYTYLGQQASLYISKYTNVVDDNTKACECAISEYLKDSLKQSNMTSESIPNAYSVSWGANDSNTQYSQIKAILELYLGEDYGYSSVGIVKLIN